MGTVDPKCFTSLSLLLCVCASYVIHMIHVEPRGAGITLTFCTQHTHTHCLRNTKDMCPHIPGPRAVCAVFLCICVFVLQIPAPSVLLHMQA